MAQDETLKQYSNFSKGIMTEASSLNFPENYSLDEENMVLDVDGSRERRQGIAFETGGAETATTTSSNAVSMSFYKWDFANNRADNSIGVVQVGTDLYFMDLTTDAPSANLLNTTNPSGTTISLSGITTETNPQLSFADINGVLLVTGPSLDQPVKLSYSNTTGWVSIEILYIMVRDLWGVDDGQEVDEELTMSVKHNYNLLNQGWTSGNLTTWGNPAPSSAQVMHIGKDSAGAWTKATCLESFFGNSPAPKGRYILPFFHRGTSRETASGLTLLNVADEEQAMFGTVATNFGRVFWGGVESDILDGDSLSPNASSLILFSQILETDANIVKCYTEADPTAEIIFDQVDSDGGFIQIPELGKVLKMEPLGNQIIILATNGVWAIVSVDGLFTPTSYQVNKVTSIGCIGVDTIIEVEGSIVYWSESGIYQLALDDVTALAKVTDVTLQTIKTYYNGIAKEAKQNAKAYYDSITKQIGWLYQSSATWDFTSFPDFCDKELIYDLQLQAFTVNTISSKSSDSPYVVGAVLGNSVNDNSIVNTVTGDALALVEANGDPVTVTYDNTISVVSKLKYLTYTPTGGFANFTLSNYGAETYLDWVTEDYTSFIETGYIGFEDFSRYKTIPYLICHFERTEDGFDVNFDPLHPSSCMIQARWEWTNSANSNRWGTAFQAYRYKRPYVPTDVTDLFDTGHTIITTKNKLRGKGRSLSLYFYSETGKNMKILGFALSAKGGSDV